MGGVEPLKHEAVGASAGECRGNAAQVSEDAHDGALRQAAKPSSTRSTSSLGQDHKDLKGQHWGGVIQGVSPCYTEDWCQAKALLANSPACMEFSAGTMKVKTGNLRDSCQIMSNIVLMCCLYIDTADMSAAALTMECQFAGYREVRTYMTSAVHNRPESS